MQLMQTPQMQQQMQQQMQLMQTPQMQQQMQQMLQMPAPQVLPTYAGSVGGTAAPTNYATSVGGTAAPTNYVPSDYVPYELPSTTDYYK
jgi:hypothetical protein